MPAQCIWFYDVLVNVTNSVAVAVQSGLEGKGMLAVLRQDGSWSYYPLPASYEEALAQWRAMMTPRTPQPHTHADGITHSH